jgi:ABC-2 type transport system ATP-binding protein
VAPTSTPTSNRAVRPSPPPPPDPPPAIEVRGLGKAYGATVAVDGLSFVVRAGEVTGFVGPNGSGKSTTMRVILGLDRPDTGSALVHGRPYRTLRRPLTVLGALLDAGAVHPGRRARDHLRWMARSNGLPVGRVGEVLDQVGLAGAARRRAGDMSLGMRQRLGLAAALLGDPPILLLDEPVNGLDPEGIRWIRGLLRGLAAEGRAVLLSSHLMSELEGVADHLVVIGRGRLVADTTVDDMVGAASQARVEVRTVHKAEAMAALATAGATVAAVDHDLVTVDGLGGAAVAEVLAATGVAFSELRPHRASLETAYMDLTRDHADFAAPAPDPPAGPAHDASHHPHDHHDQHDRGGWDGGDGAA